MIGPPGLYHGSRYADAIIKSDVLWLPASGYPMVSLTRDVRVAQYWAGVPREDDEGRGSVLVLCRTRLAARYRIRPFRDIAWHEGPPRPGEDEAEEMIWGKPITKLKSFLIDLRPLLEG